MTPTLGVLDLGLPEMESASAEISTIVQRVQAASRNGLHRYWFGRHLSRSLLSVVPDVLVSAAAPNSATMILGAGGLLLNSCDVNEALSRYRTLNHLYGERIEVGLGRGRAPQGLDACGADENPGKCYARRVARFARGWHADGGRMEQCWILASSSFGTRLAALLGLPCAVALFTSSVSSTADGDLYRSESLDQWGVPPRVMIAVGVRPLGAPVCRYSQGFVARIVGHPSSAAEQLGDLVLAYHADDVLLVDLSGVADNLDFITAIANEFVARQARDS